MGFIITTRNPSNKKLVIITKGDINGNDDAAEYLTEEIAREVAERMAICRAWGYAVMEVDI